MTDPSFRGISKLWVIKSHFQDSFHEYLVLSSNFSTFVMRIEDYLVTDVTNIMGIDKNSATLLAFNLKNSGFFFHVSSENIIVGDTTKIDSPDCHFIKFQYSNTKNRWDMACTHDFCLFCLSKSSNCISIFNIKSRSRDTELIVPVTEIFIQDIDIISDEITTFSAYVLENEFFMSLATISGKLYCFRLDSSFQILKKQSIQLGTIIETITFSLNNSSLEVYAGSRNGYLFLVNFGTLRISQIAQLSSAPLKICRFSNNALMAFNFDSSILICEYSDKCIRRKILNWDSELAEELIYRTGERFIVGIKEDSLFLMSMPPLSENVLSKRNIFQNGKISCFLLLDSGSWILGYSNVNDRKSYLKFFDKTGSEITSVEQGTDNIIRIICLDKTRSIVIVALTTKDNSQSKIQLFDLSSHKFEAINEYVCEGAVRNVKVSDRYLQ